MARHNRMVGNGKLSRFHGCPISRTNCEGAIDSHDRIEIKIDEKERIVFTWGEHYEIGTPSYWIDQAKRFPIDNDFRVGENILEETVFCVLGGHGIPAEIGQIAYQFLKDSGIISTETVSQRTEIVKILKKPMHSPYSGRTVRYRFAEQKARTIHFAMELLCSTEVPNEMGAARELLLTVPGIGLKTSSWILRNHFGSDSVAIIDIHIKRAGIAAGIFNSSWKLPAHYLKYESAFLGFAKIGGVRASVLDACIWKQMRTFGRSAEYVLPNPTYV